MGETHYDSATKMLGGFPKIKKLGAVSPNGESTPFVWNNRLMRLELDDVTNGAYHFELQPGDWLLAGFV